MEKLKIPYPVIVEGKHDKIKLSAVIDAEIFITEGFGVFRKQEKTALLRALCEKSKVIILTDSDGGGRVIRNFFNSVLDKDRLIHLYIPQIAGKETRKTKASKEGTLGVEGMDTKLLYDLFLPFTGVIENEKKIQVSKTDLYTLGLCGRQNSATLRSAIAVYLGFPADMTSTALLSAVNILYGKAEFEKILEKFLESKGK